MTTKLIRTLYYILFFFTPLIVTPWTSELFELNKMVLIYAGTLSIVFLYVLQAIMHRTFVFKRSKLDVPLLVLIAVLLLSTIFSIDRQTSIFGYYGRFNGGLLSMLSYSVLFFVGIQYFDFKSFFKLLRLSNVSSLVVMLWGLSGTFGHDLSCYLFTHSLDNSCWTDQFRPAERMFSTLGQPNWLGAYLAVQLCIALGLWFYEKGRGAKLYYAFFSLFSFICIILTNSRSAFIASVISMCVFGLFLHLLKKKKELKHMGIILATCILLFIGLNIPSLTQRYHTTISRQISTIKPLTQNTNSLDLKSKQPEVSSEISESFDIRKIVWEGAIKLTLAHPLIGTGPETFGYAYYQTRPVAHNLTSEWDYVYNKAHNEYLNYSATTGLLGLGAYLSLIGYVLYSFIITILRSRSRSINEKYLLIGLFAAYVSILITNFFGFSTTTSQLFLFLLPLGLWIPLQSEGPYPHIEKTHFTRQSVIVLAGTSIVTLFCYIWLILFVTADVLYTKATQFYQQGDLKQSLEYYSQALTLHYEHLYEDRLSSVLSQVAVAYSYSGQDDLAKQLLGLAQKRNEHALQLSPQNPFYWRTKSKNDLVAYEISQDSTEMKKAIDSLTYATKLAPTDPKLVYSLALFYYQFALDLKDTKRKNEMYVKANEAIEHAIKLKPNYQEAYMLNLKLYTKLKGDAEVQTLREKVKKVFPTLTEENIDAELQSLP